MMYFIKNKNVLAILQRFRHKEIITINNIRLTILLKYY